MKRYRRPKLKEGELRAYYGKLPGDISPDVVFEWHGDGHMRRDSSYLYYALACPKYSSSTGAKSEHSFFSELEARGYDIKTLKFSIMKKQAAA